MFPVSPNWTALTQTTPTRQPAAPAAPLLHPFPPSGTVSQPFFSQGDVPKVQNLELEQWRGGVMGQQVPARPLCARPQTLHLPALLPTPPEHKQSLSNQKLGLPAPTCPRKADLVRNVTGKAAAGMWNQPQCLGMDQSCPELRGCAALLRNVPWLPAPVTRDSSAQEKHCPPLLQPQFVQESGTNCTQSTAACSGGIFGTT